MAQGQSGVVYCQSAPSEKYKSSPSNGVEYSPVFSTFIQPPTTSPDTGNENDDRSSNISNDSGCETNKNDNEQENVKNSNNDNVVVERNERNSHCSDMSVSDTVGSPPPEVDTSSEQGYRTAKRRKYYMYKNLKLIKPIKEIPNKYLDLLKYLSLEKSRCEGEPIILAPPKVPQQVGGHIVANQVPASQCNGCQVNLNPSAQTFVPGTNGMVFQNVQNSNSSSNQGTSSASSTNHSMPPPSSPMHTACSSQNRLPNISKHYVSPNNFAHYHTISFQTGQ